jgi:hypothetical protein
MGGERLLAARENQRRYCRSPVDGTSVLKVCAWLLEALRRRNRRTKRTLERGQGGV